MRLDDRLQRCAAPVLRDVGTSTALRLQLSPWHGRGSDIGFAMHEAGTEPTRPVWETVQLVSKRGDSIAMHPVPPGDPRKPGVGDDVALMIMVAEAAQQLTQVLLWQDGRDPTWPPCASHSGHHPLAVEHRVVSWETRDGKPFVLDDSGATWACPTGACRTPIGRL